MISFWQDYSNLFKPKKYNWVNFTFINFYFEWDKMVNELEFDIGLLGLNIRIQIPLKGTTPEMEELLKSAEEAKKRIKK